MSNIGGGGGGGLEPPQLLRPSISAQETLFNANLLDMLNF